MSTVRASLACATTRNLVLISTLIFLTTTQAAVLPDVGTTNIQGPSTQSRIMGPDGSVIMSQAPGGQIIHQETPGIFEPAGRLLGQATPLFHPAVERALDTALVGPPGTIAKGTYVAQAAQDGSQPMLGAVGSSNGYNAALASQKQ